MPWLALSLAVEAALAETLSEALLEQGAHSVWIGEAERGRAPLSAVLTARSDAGAVLRRAAESAGISAPAYDTRLLADEDWVRASQAQFAPQRIAGELWIVPSWHEAPSAGVVVRLDPGIAFGTGSHPSTRLVLAWLAAAQLAGARVLDYGCGSGILAIAAAKLGAAHVDAVDLDADALGATRDNARANAARVRAFAPESLPPGEYDIVVANILAQPLLVLEPLIAARTRGGGRIALAGILETQSDQIVRAYRAHFDAAVAGHDGDWAIVEGRRR